MTVPRRRRLLGVMWVLAGGCAFVLIWRSLAWMVYGGLRDYLQLGGLALAIAAVMLGSWLLCTTPAPRP